jgi:hypothetical protein
MSCDVIVGLTLDSESTQAIERIKKKQDIGRILAASLSAGIFNSIFTKSKAPVAAFNITQTDWSLYTKAIAALPSIQKAAIQKEIDLMILHYQMGNYDHKHVTFWKGLKYGCQ